MITIILSIVISLAAILLILVVYIQNPKGGGLSSDFGNPTQLGGVKQTTEFIDKLTWGLAATIVISAIVMTTQQPKPQQIKKANPENSQQKKEAPKKDNQSAPKGN
jgi:preprotein translocase subunit SecG